MSDELIDKINELRNMEDMHYYYHVTNEDCNSILENGLFMEGDNISNVANPLPDDFWDNPIEFAEAEQGSFYRDNANIVIIGIDSDNFYDRNYIEPLNKIPGDLEFANFSNYIPSRYIVGYFDIKLEDIILNDNYDNLYRMVL